MAPTDRDVALVVGADVDDDFIAHAVDDVLMTVAGPKKSVRRSTGDTVTEPITPTGEDLAEEAEEYPVEPDPSAG